MNLLVKPNSYPWNFYHHRVLKAVLVSPNGSISSFSSSSSSSAPESTEEIKRSNSPGKFKSSVPTIPLKSRISNERDPSIFMSSILDNWIEIGLTFKLSELHNLTRKLRHWQRFNQALQVSEWMSLHRGDELSAEHFVVRLELILEVHGLEQAEEYFNSIPDTSKSYRVCSVLLLWYVNAKQFDKADLLFHKMRDMPITLTAFDYNEMLKFCVMRKHEKLMEEMEEKGMKFEKKGLDVHCLEQLAKKYFNIIPDTSLGYQVCNLLLICYANSKQLDKAELLIKKMRYTGIILTSYAYNEMLNLYAKEEKHEKLALLTEEMEVKGIIFDVTHEIRLHAYAASGDIEGMEKFLMKINMNPKIKMSFCAYCFAAYGYLKAGFIDKAMRTLKEAEQVVNVRRERDPKLLTLYAAMGNKAEVYRVWNLYRRSRSYSNIVDISMIRSLVKLGDVDGADKILQECGFPYLEFDIQVANFMITGYLRKGCLEKAEEYVNKIIERGKEPNATSWDSLATGYLLSGRMLEAVETMKKAINSKSKPGWSPSLHTLAACVKYLEDQGDKEAAKELREMINEHCPLSTDERTRLSRLYKDGELSSNAVELQMEDDQICIDITRFYYD